jgi:hypothetical protein
MSAKYLLFAGALFASRCLHAGPCTIQSLSAYEALPAGPTGGCTIGVSGIFVYNFMFSVPSMSAGYTPVSDTNITVTPTFSEDVFSLNFASTGFSVSSGQSVEYLIGYTWDPGDDVQSMDDLEDPTFTTPGFSNITSVGCLNSAFSGTCPTSTISVNVFDGPSSTQLADSTSFTPVAVLGVQNTINLEGGSGGSASMNGFTNEVTIPEPATWLGCVVFLGLLSLRRMLFR